MAARHAVAPQCSVMAIRTRGATALAIGSAVSGVLAYLFFALVTRALGSERAAPVAVLWACWSFAGAALTFPVQQWITRTMEATGGEAAVRRARWRVLRAVLVVTTGAVAVAWVLRHVLFNSTGAAFPALVGGVTFGAALVGYARGVLGGRGRFRLVGVSLVVENSVRCLAAGVAIAFGADEPAVYGGCLLIGYVAAATWPSVFRLGHAGGAAVGSAVGFLGGASGGQLVAQAVLTGGPVVLALVGGSPAQVTALFAGLALFRAPYTIAVGAVAPLTSMFTRLVVERRADRLRWFRNRILAGGAAAAVLGLVLAWRLGPWLLRAVFGDDVRLSPAVCAILAVASAAAIVNLISTVMLMSLGRTSGLLRAWLLAVLPGALWFAVAPGAALEATASAFLVIEVAAVGLLVRTEARATSRLGSYG